MATTVMRGMLVLTAALLLGGCVANTVRQDEAAVFDLGETAGPWQAPALRGVDVAAPSWLGTAAMQYRLAYVDGSRRRAYVESRWAAPPAELVELALRRRAVASSAGGDAMPVDCRLRIDLDEFVQTFDSAQSSRVVLALRARLVSRNEQPLASRAFKLERAAASADARGGVVAATAAVQALGAELSEWLAALAREKSALATRCNI